MRERISMRKSREILRHILDLKLPYQVAEQSLGVSHGLVCRTLAKVRERGMTWPDLAPLSEEELELLLYGPPKLPVSSLAMPDWALVDAERRRPGVTLLLLHEEYKQSHPNGLSYSQFCEQYRRFRSSRPLLQRQEYVAGDKMLVDYSGKRPHYFNPATGQRIDCELFVAVLGASNLTFAHASATQRREDFLRSHMRAVEYFGGVTRLWIPDNLKSAVTRACRYEPTVQRDYQELAEHYGAAILPTRPYKPTDKAKVEVAVQITQRWILARLRNVRCFSLAELNGHIRRLLEELNHRLMPGYGRSRWELFAQIEKDKLRPLPKDSFELSETKEAKVQIDSHVAFEGHSYSAPYQLQGESVLVRATGLTVEIFHRGKRVASHLRSRQRGGYTTLPEHLPKAYRNRDWSPGRLLNWAARIGPHTSSLCRAILEQKLHPEHSYKRCLGLLRLAKRYDQERLEAACERAFAAGARSYQSVKAILEQGLDRIPIAREQSPQRESIEHEHLRGPKYYN